MLHYPKIPGSAAARLGRCVAFEKYDGTNLHWEWERGFGWHAFGPRRGQFNLDAHGIAQFESEHAHLGESVAVFRDTLAEPLEKLFLKHAGYGGFESFKVFTEFCGAHSFAGLHQKGEAKSLVLFDVWAEPFGMIGPAQFVADFGHLPSARVVYQGKLTGQFVHDVREGKYGVAEGVVCKGGAGGSDLWMVKVKTLAYMEKLKLAFAADWENYWE